MNPRTLLLLAACALVWGKLANSAEEGAIYSPVGKRDPFKEPLVVSGDRSPTALRTIEQYGIDQLTLRAILRGGGVPRAMFEDPRGYTYIVKPGDTIGRERGQISRILNTDVVITERTFNYLGTESLYERVISLPQD